MIHYYDSTLLNHAPLYFTLPANAEHFKRIMSTFGTYKTSNTKNRLVFRKPNICRQLGPSVRRLIISRAKLPGGAEPTLALCR